MTGRDIDPATDEQLVSNGGWIVFLVDVFLDEGTQRLGAGFIGKLLDTSEPGDNIFEGVGEFGSFQIGAETIGALASGVRYSISGVDPSNNTEVTGFRDALGTGLQTRVQNRRVRLRMAAVNQAVQIVGTPILLRDDLGDSLTLNDGGDTLELILTAEMKSVDFKRLRRSTNSSADHKRLHPGSPPDTFFDDDRWRRTDIRWGQQKTDGDPTA